MANERQDDANASSVEEWPKRTPPTIDLQATDVSKDTEVKAEAGAEAAPSDEKVSDDQPKPKTASGAFGTVLAPVSGALAALAVLTGAWFGGFVGQQPQPSPPSVSPTQFDNVAANVGDLTARMSRVEASAAKAPGTDPALLARADALEKAIAAARNDLTALKSQAASTATALNDLKAAAPSGDGSAPVNLAPLTEKIARLEQTTQALSAELAARKAQSADDINVRRLVVANTLESAVQRGAPFVEALAAAKQMTVDAALLAPLDAFAAKGIPSDTAYLRDIVQVLQQIAASNAAKASDASKVAADKASASEGVLERVQSSLSRLVRIERADTPAAPSSGQTSVASLEALARRDDFAAVRRDLAKLPQADNPQVQAWIKAVNARDAALAAARQFSAQALAAVTKSGQ
jgi:hypothetical protein